MRCLESFREEKHTAWQALEREGLASEIKAGGSSCGIPIMGTCAGLVLLAKYGDDQVEKTMQSYLELWISI